MPRRVFRQEPDHAYLRQEYKLDRWIEKPPDRALKYYDSIDGFRVIIIKNFEVSPRTRISCNGWRGCWSMTIRSSAISISGTATSSWATASSATR